MERRKLDGIVADSKLLVAKAAENTRKAEDAVRWTKELRITAAQTRAELREAEDKARHLIASGKSKRRPK